MPVGSHICLLPIVSFFFFTILEKLFPVIHSFFYIPQSACLPRHLVSILQTSKHYILSNIDTEKIVLSITAGKLIRYFLLGALARGVGELQSLFNIYSSVWTFYYDFFYHICPNIFLVDKELYLG